MGAHAINRRPASSKIGVSSFRASTRDDRTPNLILNPALRQDALLVSVLYFSHLGNGIGQLYQ